MPDIGVFEFIQDLLTQILGYPPPHWVSQMVAALILLGLVIILFQTVASALMKIWREFIQPVFYNNTDRYYRVQRQRFASFIETRMRDLDNQEAWDDNRFAEFEAIVQMEGKRKLFGIFPSTLDRKSTRLNSSHRL